jgi:hypothetical protein
MLSNRRESNIIHVYDKGETKIDMNIKYFMSGDDQIEKSKKINLHDSVLLEIVSD